MGESMHDRPRLLDVLGAGRTVAEHRPWPRAVVSHDDWRRVDELCCPPGSWALLALWADGEHVHMARRRRRPRRTSACSASSARTVASPRWGRRTRLPCVWSESIRESWGLEPEGLADARPWLNHGKWNPPHDPEAAGNHRDGRTRTPSCTAEGESLHQIAVGPVHAGIIEPGHFRFTANGEAVVRLEARLGYVHKGTEWLMEGMPVERAAVLAGRVSGDSTVAYALAFARAIEAAHDIEVPSARGLAARA